MNENHVRAIAVIVSAGLMVLAFPPFELWGCVVVSLLLLLWGLRGGDGRVGFRIGLYWGFLVYAGTLVWLWTLFGGAAVGLWLILALFTGGFGSCYAHLIENRKSGWWTGVLAAVFWVGFEYFRGEWFNLRFAWITPGTSLPPNLLSPWMGVYGVSFVLVLAIAWLLEPVWKTRIAGSLVILGLLASVFLQMPSERKAGQGLRVALVQCDEGALLDNLEVTQEALSKEERVDVVVWPEYAVSYDVREHPSDMAHLTGLAKEQGGIVILGSQTGLPEREFHNSALTIDAGGVVGVHHKQRPVHFFSDGLAGVNPQPVETDFGLIGTPICFDCDYTTVVRQLTSRGASMILVPSLDPKEWGARQYEQHARLFQHRAAENRRWVAVASGAGVTQIIDPQGVVQARLPGMDTGVLVGEVFPMEEKTLFTRGGWVVGPLCVVLTLAYISALMPWVKRWNRARDEKVS